MRGEVGPITATDAVLLSPSRCTWEPRSGDVQESGSLGVATRPANRQGARRQSAWP
jgi:hypothetical protein